MMLLAQAAKILNGKIKGPSDVRFMAVSTDTRKIKTGDLYIALRGEKFDGADFIAQAMQSGAVAALVNEESFQVGQEFSCPVILVADTRIALGQLAAHWRQKFTIPMVAITGSNGKTTVKEMLASVLRIAAGSDDAVLATKGNFNNDIGMPLTLLQLNAQHRYAVIEMGMNHPGEIDYLTRIACPNVALINNASGAHLEGMGSVEAVAHAKGEIFSGLQSGGSAIINADDEFAPLWRSLAGAHSLLEFGLSVQSDISGSWQPNGAGLRLDAKTPVGDFTVDMQVPGEHNARNALAVTAAAIALNLSLESIVAGLAKFGGVDGRLQRKSARGGAVLIDDTYNANPASLKAAIAVLAGMSGQRVLVLGDMGELGEDAAQFHAGIGIAARESGIEKLYALGELTREAVREFGARALHFERIEALFDVLDKELKDGTTVLVKGSRFMKMERVVKHLVSSESEVASGINTANLPLTTAYLPKE
ncbi:MAG: UDP-N-acetylmuramoyl-tripeptide--D-alanyl-D-alanine ligase [Gallionella sp.]|jgi:UDP-N-acetylmuramoyl-tripeptide--D-alanyl-D-alanine ligase|nr:UDP-N-acetylmuramoyl-tripeptide--D-alanyl-D-alanine ligase [Gallionella sp.]